MGAALSERLGWAPSVTAIHLRRLHAAFLDRLNAEGGLVSLSIAQSPAVSAFSLAPEVSRIFGELGITLEFEFTDE